jgi:hypothetical protein
MQVIKDHETRVKFENESRNPSLIYIVTKAKEPNPESEVRYPSA